MTIYYFIGKNFQYFFTCFMPVCSGSKFKMFSLKEFFSGTVEKCGWPVVISMDHFLARFSSNICIIVFNNKVNLIFQGSLSLKSVECYVKLFWADLFQKNVRLF